jgi:hypothetical protein
MHRVVSIALLSAACAMAQQRDFDTHDEHFENRLQKALSSITLDGIKGVIACRHL